MTIRPFMLNAIASAILGGLTLPSMGNLVTRFSADSITPQTDNTNLVTWTDSINGIVATQATSGSQPKYRTAGLDGKPCVQFAGSAFLPITTPGAMKTAMDSGIFTMVVVVDQVGANSFGGLVGGSTFGGQCLFATGSRAGWRELNATAYSVPTAATGMTVLGITSTSSWSAGSPNLKRAYVQGGCIASFPNTVSATTANPCIGSMGAGGGGNAIARIHDIFVWNTALSPLDMLKVQAFICAKYNQPLPWSSASKLFIAHGNSLSANVGTSDVIDGYAYKAATANSLALGQWSMLAVGGVQMNTLMTRTSEVTEIAAYTQKPSVITCFEWANDKNAFSASQCWDHVVTYSSAVKSVPNNRLILGSSLGYNGDPSTPRMDFNNLADANAAAICDQYVPSHTNALIGTQTAYATGSSTYWNADGLHFIAAGQTVIKDIFQSAIAAQLAA